MIWYKNKFLFLILFLFFSIIQSFTFNYKNIGIWLNFFYTIDIYNYIYFNYANQPVFIFFAVNFFFSGAFIAIFQSYLGFYGIFFIILISLFLFWINVFIFLNFIFYNNLYFYINFGKWVFFSNNIIMKFDFFFDNISISFLFLTLTISLFVIIFTFSYFKYEPLIDRLLMFLNYFILSMIFLVSTNNFINFFLGWELIGLTSFILINFWSTKILTLKSAFKAFSFNKFSDVFLLLSIVLIINISFNTDILIFLNLIDNFNSVYIYFLFIKINYLDALSFLLLISASIKSAQIGVHIWLPDSMEAPVPASALIHSATLVSAGVYILLRFSSIFNNSYIFLIIICILGSITALYGGLSSMNQFDTKKILAYSTISHCGFLFVLTTVNIFEFTLLYLYIHGFFKAAIFMCVGGINKLNKNNQDIRKMGYFLKFIPFECILLVIGLLNLSGLPFTLGFFIKHLLFLSIKTNIYLFLFIFFNCLFAAFTGLYYSFRLIYYIFFDFKKNKVYLYCIYNSKSFFSSFYSNSSIGNIFSIVLLFFFSYFISIYFLNLYLSKNNFLADNLSIVEYSSIYIYNLNNLNIIVYFKFINWLVIINIMWLIFSNFRKLNLKINLYLFYIIILFIVGIFLT